MTIHTGSDTIIAPPKQYALINTSASLNCSTTLSKEESNSISISWHRENQPASEVFDSVSLAHEGMYECRLYIALLGLETTRMINFSVIGKFVRHAWYTCTDIKINCVLFANDY